MGVSLRETGFKQSSRHRRQLEAENQDEFDRERQGGRQGRVGQDLQGRGRHWGRSSVQDARRLPADEDLLLPLERPERQLRLREEPREERDGRRRSGREQDRRPDRRSPGAQRAARLPAEGGPRQLQDPVSLHPGGDRQPVPEGLHPRGPRGHGQVLLRRVSGSVREVPLSCCSEECAPPLSHACSSWLKQSWNKVHVQNGFSCVSLCLPLNVALRHTRLTQPLR